MSKSSRCADNDGLNLESILFGWRVSFESDWMVSVEVFVDEFVEINDRTFDSRRMRRAQIDHAASG